MTKLTAIRFVLKPLVFVACLVPAVLVVTDLLEVTGSLAANPIEDMLDRFGIWGIRFACVALAVTPLRKLTGWNWLSRFRRPLGLFAFFYVLMHFLVWLLLDRELVASGFGIAGPLIVEDIVERPFITVGFIAFVLLLSLALTSTVGMRRRLGRRWQQLHYGAYVAGLLGVWHYWWQVKNDASDPQIYAAILAALLGYRLFDAIRRRKRTPTRAAPQTP
ncbi:MAG: protein-methionine-sulfoxide reductase heme-binding subunit MsrQ [Pseudomonadota bacterium]